MRRGPFSMGQTLGMTVNIVSLAWLVFAIVFFSFPYQMPVTGMCLVFYDSFVSCPSYVLTATQYQT